MQHVIKLSAALTTLLALAACSDRDHNDNAAGDGNRGASGQDAMPPADTATPPSATPATDAGMPPATADGTASATASAGDADLLGVLAAIDQHEIDAATQAKTHTLPADVGQYADMMITDHRANLEATQALGANLQNTKATAQANAGKAHLEELGKKPDAQYASAFVDAMVQGHTQALATLDEQLIPSAQSAQVKAHFQATRAKVAEHLEKAKGLQKK